MQVTYMGTSYDCARAIRKGSTVILHLTDGGIASLYEVSDIAWKNIALLGGEWDAPMPVDHDRISAIESALTSLMLGGMVNTEFLQIQYLLGNLTQESVQSAVPRLLTNDQANTITGGIAK